MNLEIKNITKSWHTRTSSLNTLDDISLTVKENEFVCIIGPSGCGKTSLLKVVAGIVSADSGQILFDREERENPNDSQGMVFQEPPLYPWKTVRQNIEIGLIFRKVNSQKRDEIVSDKLELTGLKEFEHYYPHQLSGGMKQKVQLARVLALNPEIVLLDEPFAAMDEILRHKFDSYLLDLWKKEKKSFIFVTHSIEEALLLADRIIIMKPNPGKIHLEQKIDLPRPRDLFSKDIVELRKYLRNELSKFY
jgi:NitT/TauT family transport system ATP-binding protein